MLDVTDLVRIPEEELEWSYARAGGPGGQNVNKVASKAILRWKMTSTTASISEPVRARMRSRFPSRFTTDGDVIIQSQRYRDQERNREDCLQKLIEMIQLACVEPTPRKATKPTKGSQRRRLDDKRRQADKKKHRRASGGDD